MWRGEDNASQEAKDVDISERYNLDKNTPAWQLDNKEEVTELTWYVNADWWNDEWGNDVVTKNGRRFEHQSQIYQR